MMPIAPAIPTKPCRPTVPLYVDLTAVRGGESLAAALAVNIQRADTNHFLKQLISGHRGTGKSTELQRLVKNLREANYFVVYLDIENTLDLGDIEYQDVLVAIAQAVVRDALAAGIAMKSSLLNDLESWFDERILTDEQKRDFESLLKTDASVEGHVPFFAKILASITAQFKSGSSQKKELRHKLEAQMSGFLDKLNVLIGQARDGAICSGKVNLVVIVDGLEKMRYYKMPEGESSHTVLFVHHAAQLAAPNSHIVYTLPISLCFRESLKEEFPDEPILLPMVDTMHMNGQQCLAELLHRRVAASVFDTTETIQKLIAMSGGSVRDLLRLVRSACPVSGDIITAKDAEKAISNFSNEYDRLLREGDIDKLREIDASRALYYDEDTGRFLEQRLVHEYRNGKVWYAVHPAVRRIKRYQDALKAEN